MKLYKDTRGIEKPQSLWTDAYHVYTVENIKEKRLRLMVIRLNNMNMI